jgi:S-layer protein (TIGR01567 family)
MFSGFKITSINNDTTLLIRFDDADDKISLIKNQTVSFIGDTFNFKINEDGDIGGLVVMITEPGVHEIFENVGKLSSGGYANFYLTSVNNPGILYYDLDEGVGSEVLDITVSNDDLEIAKGNFTYNTTVYKDENNNDMIAWLGKPHSVIDKSGDWYLSELLIDEDNNDTHLLEVGETLTLKEGYTVILQGIGVYGEDAWFNITKDGDVVYSSVQCEGSQYIYEEDLNDSGSTDNWVIKFNVETVIAGTNMVKINHTRQISSDVVKAEDGDKDLFDGFVIKTDDTAEKIEIVIDGCDDEIKLKKGGTVSLLGDRFNFKVNEDGDIGGILKIVSINESWRNMWMGKNTPGGTAVTTSELQDAIHHWLDNLPVGDHTLSTQDLQEVIAIWLFE